jgi:hypothetical protein
MIIYYFKVPFLPKSCILKNIFSVRHLLQAYTKLQIKKYIDLTSIYHSIAIIIIAILLFNAYPYFTMNQGYFEANPSP